MRDQNIFATTAIFSEVAVRILHIAVGKKGRVITS